MEVDAAGTTDVEMPRVIHGPVVVASVAVLEAHVAGRVDGSHYTLQVRDDGAGIPATLEDRLFTRFIHKGSEPLLTGSVGLGLAIAQLLTTLTGGTISYRRELDETVFAVRFPVVSSEVSPAERVSAIARSLSDRKDLNPAASTRPASKPDLKTLRLPPPTRIDQQYPMTSDATHQRRRNRRS